MTSDLSDYTFIGSIALMDALLKTYVEHIGIAEPEGPDGPYMWCGCGWRSDDLSNNNPGLAYAIHLTNAQHAAAVKALQPRVMRIPPGGETGQAGLGSTDTPATSPRRSESGEDFGENEGDAPSREPSDRP